MSAWGGGSVRKREEMQGHMERVRNYFLTHSIATKHHLVEVNGKNSQNKILSFITLLAYSSNMLNCKISGTENIKDQLMSHRQLNSKK